MKKDDWLKIAKWTAYIYAPIALLIIGVFLLAEYRAKLLEKSAPVSPHIQNTR
jgi:hypothetical protein